MGTNADRPSRVDRSIQLEELVWLVEAPATTPATLWDGREVVYSREIQDITITGERGGTLVFSFPANEEELSDWNPSSKDKSLRTVHLQVMNSFLLLVRDAELEASDVHLNLQRVSSDDWIIEQSDGRRHRGLHQFDLVEEGRRYEETRRVIQNSTLNLAADRLKTALTHPDSDDLIEVLDLVCEANMAQELDNSTAALVSAWAAIEYHLRRAWSALKRRASRDLSAETVAGDLLAAEQLTREEHDNSIRVRRARNAWLHSKERPSWWDAQHGVHLARTLVAKELGLAAPSQESWHRPMFA